MSDNTPLGDRMKVYERAFQQYLPRRSYTLLRLDGRAFHTYTRGLEKPFDKGLVKDMDLLTVRLAEEIQGVQFAYTQSDEVSLLLTDFETTQTQPWVGGRLDKTLSLAAALASSYLTQLRYFVSPAAPQFDCRVWSMSDPVEVANYFVWRQRDAVRNSIQSLGRSRFSQREMHGKSTGDVMEMLYRKHGIDWHDLDDGLKRGRLVLRADGAWKIVAAPIFTAAPQFELARLIPELPRLND